MGPEGLLTTMITDRDPYTTVLAQVDPNGSVGVAADDLAFPNGVVTVDGGATLVVAQTLGLELTTFDRAADGALTNRRAWGSLADSMIAPDRTRRSLALRRPVVSRSSNCDRQRRKTVVVIRSGSASIWASVNATSRHCLSLKRCVWTENSSEFRSPVWP